jgi:hypothetical protein
MEVEGLVVAHNRHIEDVLISLFIRINLFLNLLCNISIMNGFLFQFNTFSVYLSSFLAPLTSFPIAQLTLSRSCRD